MAAPKSKQPQQLTRGRHNTTGAVDRDDNCPFK